MWTVAPRSLIEVCRRCRGDCCLHHHGHPVSISETLRYHTFMTVQSTKWLAVVWVTEVWILSQAYVLILTNIVPRLDLGSEKPPT